MSTPADIDQGLSMTTVTLKRKTRYEFVVRVDETSFIVDEGPPLGEGHGPSPDALLGAATGSCLASSLLFCLEKAHLPVDNVSARVDVEKVRNERGRLRIGSIRVGLAVHVPEEYHERFERCRQLFEDFCIVTESIRHGIHVEVGVSTS
jgi:organic hydroperoxide reductase OsmC/OhrA